MPSHTPKSEDFVLDFNQTGTILELSGRTIQKSLVLWTEGEEVTDGQLAYVKRRGVKGYKMNFIAKPSVLTYLRMFGRSVNIARARSVIQDPGIIEELESHNRSLQVPETDRKPSEAPQVAQPAPVVIERDARDMAEIAELKGERETLRGELKELRDKLDDEKERRINLLAGAVVFNDYANSMIEAAKRGELDVSYIPQLPRPSKEGEWQFPRPDPTPQPPRKEEKPQTVIEVEATPEKKHWWSFLTKPL